MPGGARGLQYGVFCVKRQWPANLGARIRYGHGKNHFCVNFVSVILTSRELCFCDSYLKVCRSVNRLVSQMRKELVQGASEWNSMGLSAPFTGWRVELVRYGKWQCIKAMPTDDSLWTIVPPLRTFTPPFLQKKCRTSRVFYC